MSRFTAALAAEWRKLTSTALWWVLALGMAAYLAFVGAAMAFSLTVAPEGFAPPLGGLDAALTVYGVLNAVGYVFPLVVGTLLVTTEVRHKTLTQTLLAEPRRGVVLGAKLVLAAGIGLLYGVAGVVGLVAAGAPVLSAVGDGAFLDDPEVVRALLLGVLVTGLWAVLGTGFGAVVPQQVAAVVAILAFTQFVEPIARLALGAVDGLSVVSAYLPGAAADAVVGASLFSQMGDVDLLPAWGGALVLLGYAAALTLAGRLATFARDVV
ncbi:ABC transporter permease [uncultured Nocardioides sp.]|uniref:ABC transporter permease n=1 Tax=uncultured Nocardioides sp. TaxID=198441 RepID=UPI00262DDEEC|nr:ABC transporter permease [uncultured Nocardioides sp.]